MDVFRVRWTNAGDPQIYGSELIRHIDEAYEYRDSVTNYVEGVWIERAQWEFFSK